MFAPFRCQFFPYGDYKRNSLRTGFCQGTHLNEHGCCYMVVSCGVTGRVFLAFQNDVFRLPTTRERITDWLKYRWAKAFRRKATLPPASAGAE